MTKQFQLRQNKDDEFHRVKVHNLNFLPALKGYSYNKEYSIKMIIKTSRKHNLHKMENFNEDFQQLGVIILPHN